MVANVVHISKHHTYCLQRQHHLIADDRTIESLTLESPKYAHVIPWCQSTQSLRVLHFSVSVLKKLFSECDLKKVYMPI